MTFLKNTPFIYANCLKIKSYSRVSGKKEEEEDIIIKNIYHNKARPQIVRRKKYYPNGYVFCIRYKI